MAKIYYIDIPTEETIAEDESYWTNVKVTKTKEEAVEWIRANIGPCDDEGNICLITAGDDGEEDDLPPDPSCDK